MVEGDQGVEDALSILQDQAVRGVILPLNRLSMINVYQIDGFDDPRIKRAKDVVQVKDEYRKVVDLLLSNTVVVPDRVVARKFISTIENQRIGLELRVVTFRGEIFHSRGQVTAGLGSNSNILIRSGKSEDLKRKSALLNNRLENLKHELDLKIKKRESLKARESDLLVEYQEIHFKLDELMQKNRANINEFEGLSKRVEWTKEQRERKQSEIYLQERQTESFRLELAELETSFTEIKAKERGLAEELFNLNNSGIQSELAHWNTRLAVLERIFHESNSRKIEREQQLDEHRSRLSKSQAELNEIELLKSKLMDEINTIRSLGTHIGEEIERLQGQIVPAENEINQAELRQTELLKNEVKARQAVSQVENTNAQARIALARRQERLEDLRRRIEDDFGLVAFEYVEEISGPKPLPIQGMIEELPVVSEASPGLDDAIKRQRALLRRIGPINPEARKEFVEVEDRYGFLISQMNDLHKAAADIQEVIKDLDEMMKRQFRMTFDAVANEFHRVFSRLFGGGTARLVLTDPNNLTETGIDIEARLPGRREQGLSLLSGGERSLSAVALVFALLLVSPTPFCVLDEVDAMLDEANVGRFGELLKELSQTTQFVLITHNRATVQLADVIYGVTMGRDSTSQTISLKMDEIEKIV
jgi:chromosome segregation protein